MKNREFRRSYGLLTLLFVGIALFSNVQNVVNYPPRSVHQWRQSDCAAYVKTYYRNGTGLLTPGTYNLAGKNGRVVSEFPILYYLDAKISKAFGLHYWIPRGVNMLCFFFGICCLYACCKRWWIRQPIFALFPPLLLATSPYYYYYGVNFLPNVPAISFSFAGLYFFLLFHEKNRLIHLITGTAFFVLATLLKPTDGGIVWLGFLGVALFQPKEYKKQWLPLSASALVIAAGILWWSKYAMWYNDQNGNHQNLLDIYPIWTMDEGAILYTAKRVITSWSNVYQQKIVIGVIAIAGVIFVVRWRQLHRFLRLFTVFMWLAAVAYSVLWFKAYSDHDYYQLPLVLPGLFLSITVLEYLVRTSPAQWASIRMALPIVLIICIAMGVWHNRNIQHERYTDPIYHYANPSLFKIEPYLRSIGVKANDYVVCVPDPSPNVSLNAINNYGYTESFNGEGYDVRRFHDLGAKYLIISDSNYLTKSLYLPFLNHKIGERGGIYIFDIRL